MPDERIRDEFVSREREGLERRVEIGDAVLDEQADEVQTSDGEFTLGAREDGTVRIRRYEQRNDKLREGGVASVGRKTGTRL